MKKILLFAPVLLMALAGCVKDEPYVDPNGNNPGPEPGPGPTPTPTVAATPVFNEFDCGNKKIEIYNPGDSEIDITGWTLTKDETEWEIPAGRGKIAAKGYAVFTGKSDGTTDPTFGLSGTKGFLMVLKDKDGKEIDKVDNTSERDGGIVTIEDGKSWGRKTDGASEWVIFDTPTIGAPNGGGSAPAEVVKLCLNEVYGAGADNEKFFELYNAGNKAVSLSGYTINKDEDLCWTGIDGEEVPAGGFFAIIGAKGTTDRGFSSGFSAKKTVLVELFDPDGKKIDQFQRGEKGDAWGTSLPNNAGSWSRIPDGTGKWMITEAFTPNAANSKDGVEDENVIQ